VYEGNAAGERRIRVEAFLSKAYTENAFLPIRQPTPSGAFLGSWLEGLFGESLLVVPDTTVLRNDINHACESGRRGVLLTAANVGAIRLFCARHVVEEVQKYLQDWADHKGLPYELYVNQWNNEYLPLLRIVEQTDILPELLSPVERERVGQVGTSKDVPSITLALAIGALYLTKDLKAWAAVYGRAGDTDDLYDWLPQIRHGGKAGELNKMLALVSAIPALAIVGTASLTAWISKKSLIAFGAAAAVVLALAMRVPRETYGAIGTGILEFAAFIGTEIYVPLQEARERFLERCPARPNWEHLVGSIERRSLLARACIYYLARSNRSPMSAAQLADEVPSLGGVGRSARLVRTELRKNSCFREVYRGRWQLGRAHMISDRALFRV